MDRKELQKKYGIIGESPALKQALDKVLQVAPTEITVLLYGETGVGKDVIARVIHDLSPRNQKNLVIVNCGAIPEGIIESELFGHEKGAYTGAHESRMGYFEQADGGTIFLDEIVDTPKNVQVKLLRILESGEFFRVGSSKPRKVNTRVIAASNKDMWKSVEAGDFRQDLFYRLNTITISIPPLRERGNDILLIFRDFVSHFAKKYDSVFRGMSDEARQLLLSYRWPGNIRELRNVAEQLVVLEKSQFVNEDVLKKYLKGRQSLGSADNLPMLFDHDEQHQHQTASATESRELQLIYRALLDMNNERGDMKRMSATLFYHTFREGGLPKHLPAHTGTRGEENPQNPQKPASAKDINDLMVGVAPYSDAEIDDVDDLPEQNHNKGPYDEYGPADHDINREGENHASGTENLQELTDDQRHAAALFGKEDLPSLEDVEKFLIKRALEKYSGNRRKAARILGMSERTLYRKIDQYELL